MILGIDFDNTIHDIDNPIPGRKMGRPIEGSQEALEDLHQSGHKIIVHTVRGKSKAVADWLDYWDISYDEITNIKPNADWFIDDRNIEFDTWQNVMTKLGVDDE